VALLELKGFGVELAQTQVSGVDLTVEPASILAVVGRGDGATSLLALAIAGLQPGGAKAEGTLNFSGKRVLYLDRESDAAAVMADAELIVADEPGRGRDPATQLELLTALQAASRTAAVIIFTADFRLALSMGLEVAVLSNGRLLLRAPASQIFELPQYDTVRHLVGGERLRTRTLMRPPIGEPILEVDGVSRTYRRGLPRLGPPPVEALTGIGFAVRQGEVVGVLGPAAAGKTTLLRLVAGLDKPSAGRIGRRPGLVGYVFPDPRKAFNPTLPVGVSLTEPLRVEQTLLVEEQADRLVDAVRAVGLAPELLARLPGAFGMGELQRMALARALVGRPGLLLLDDPTACLDPAEAREFLVYLTRVRADFGLTAIVASREFEVVKAVADRVLVLEAGHIVEGGKPGELSDAPKHEITRRLVSMRYPPPVRHADEPLTVVDEQAGLAVVVAAAALTAVEQLTAGAARAEPVPEGETPVTELLAAAVPVEAEAVVAAPSTSLADDPPSPSDGGSPTTEVVAAPEPELVTEPAAMPDLEPALVAASAPEPELIPEPEPEPTHSLSATIVIAPVVLAEPELPLPAEPVATPEPQPVMAEIVEEVAAAPAATADDPEPRPPDGSDVPSPPEPEVQSSAEPIAPPSGDGADEAAEGGEAQAAVDGTLDAAGSIDTTDVKPAG
jgi:ABC-type glutathione transport system ATPase component